MSVEDVEQLLTENADQMALAAELDAAVARHLGTGNELDEEEIEREYEQLLAADSAALQLPDAPAHEPVVAGAPEKVPEAAKAKTKAKGKTAVPAN
jgi:hypothetical protein